MREFLSRNQKKSNVVINFLRQNTGVCIIPVADKLQYYLNANEIISLFFVLRLELQESFVDVNAKEISELIDTFKANIVDLDQYIRINFITKSRSKKIIEILLKRI